MDLSSHVVQNGDSLLRLQFYSDPAANDSADNNNAGAGCQTDQAQFQWKPGTKFYVARRMDSHASVVGILLLMPCGGYWPGEFDFCENGMAWVHWSSSDQTKGFTMPAGTDESVWHVWGCEYGATQLSASIDGTTWMTMTNPTTDATDVNGMLRPMFMSTQVQDGDMTYPSAPIPYAQRVEQQIDWVAIDEPV